MPTDPLRTISRHQTNNERPDNRHSDCVDSELILRRGNECGIEPMIVGNVGKQADEFQQKPGNARADKTNCDRNQGNRNYMKIGGEVTEFFQTWSSLLISFLPLHSCLPLRASQGGALHLEETGKGQDRKGAAPSSEALTIGAATLRHGT